MKRARHKRINTVCCHLHKVTRVAIFTETESRKVVSGGGEKEEWELLFNWYRDLVWDDVKGLEMKSCDSYNNVNVLMVLNCSLRNSLK